MNFVFCSWCSVSTKWFQISLIFCYIRQSSFNIGLSLFILFKNTLLFNRLGLDGFIRIFSCILEVYVYRKLLLLSRLVDLRLLTFFNLQLFLYWRLWFWLLNWLWPHTFRNHNRRAVEFWERRLVRHSHHDGRLYTSWPLLAVENYYWWDITRFYLVWSNRSFYLWSKSEIKIFVL